jgi:hypothetical protein
VPAASANTRVASGPVTARDCTGGIAEQQNVRVDFTAGALHTFVREEDSEGNPSGFEAGAAGDFSPAWIA